ncbi:MULTISPECIES: hypothetical protein [Mycolicibacterium]|uniref:Uncharacterized protein n=2 Tax=Mycolicibacterium TaxID=1866885 RepID=A0AAW5SHM1_MYCNV|nr:MULTISPECIES: hypothetical protein [Mycolicibacterium]EHB45816.1 hypothetical protein MycrhDRAFT_6294 [Mycolicibacterium rhodesiae JS60]MCV7022872.1 hypothetical protein [Mycolicibacterium novocastrense]MDG5486591.1 hypothetical protein [Mycolicibacterium gadium]GAT12978.1 putative uncharacterized protein [Mycolicibacterium novocastrense]
MDDDHDYGCDRGGPLRTEADRLLQAKYHQKERDRNKRDMLSRIVDVLDDVAPQHRPRPHHLADVASFYGVHPRAVLTVLRRHREEFESDGWRQSDPHRRRFDYWPDEAVVRAGLLLDRSTVADQLRHLLGQGTVPLVYSLSDARINQCHRLYRKALGVVGDVHDRSPDELWHSLQQTDRYELMALVVALAALIDDEKPSPGGWLRRLSTPTGKRKDGSIRRGLALLIPMRQNTDERRQPRPGVALDCAEAAVDSAVAQ